MAIAASYYFSLMWFSNFSMLESRRRLVKTQIAVSTSRVFDPVDLRWGPIICIFFYMFLSDADTTGL